MHNQNALIYEMTAKRSKNDERRAYPNQLR